MNKHKDLRLRDYDIKPTNEVLEQILMSGYAAYENFQERLPKLEIEQNWQWYTPHKVWCAKGQHFWTTIRGTRKEKVLYWLYIYDGHFTVVIWFKEKNRSEVLEANISEKTKQIICDSKTQMGLPTFPVSFDITTEESLADIYTLIDCKKRIEGK